MEEELEFEGKDSLRQSEIFSTKSVIKADFLDGFMMENGIFESKKAPMPLEINPKTNIVPIEKEEKRL